MSVQRHEELLALLDEAERAQLLFAPHDNALRRSLRVRTVPHGDRPPTVIEVRRGCFAATATWCRLSPPERCRRLVRTLAREHPTWVFSHATAAHLYGWHVPYRLLWPLHLVFASHRTIAGCICHRTRNLVSTCVDDVLVTAPERTLFDCTASLPLPASLPIVDAALRSRIVEAPACLRSWQQSTFIKSGGWQQAQRALMLGDGRAESGGESVARAAMYGLGYQIPQLQVPFADPLDCNRWYRADFFWPDAHGGPVIGELDGLAKYVDPKLRAGRTIAATFARERQREARLSASGMRLMRFTFEAVRRPRELARLLDCYGIAHERQPASSEQLQRDVALACPPAYNEPSPLTLVPEPARARTPDTSAAHADAAPRQPWELTPLDAYNDMQL